MFFSLCNIYYLPNGKVLRHNSRFQLQDGQGNLKLWADIAKGQLQNVQASLRLHHLVWLDKADSKKIN